MKVDDDLDFVFLGPTDGLEEIVVLPLNIWFARTDDIVGPIPYRDAHVIESKNKSNAEHVWLAGI